MKERFSVIASSLGSYFGVGFHDPNTQILIDTGVIDDEPDEDALFRMEVGNILEDASLNCLEYKLKIRIDNRNVEVKEALDGMLRLKLDGETVFEGEPTVVENKVSNSKSSIFTKNKGYHLQCQAYMMVTGYNQAILGGLYRGQVIHEVIKRDDSVIEDIKRMVTIVYGIMNGLLTMDEYPWELVDKYSKTKIPETLDTFDFIEDEELVLELMDIKSTKSDIDAREKAINNYLKGKYSNVSYQGSGYKLTINSFVREGTIDTKLLELDHPELDLSKYKGEPTEVQMVRINKTKGS